MDCFLHTITIVVICLFLLIIIAINSYSLRHQSKNKTKATLIFIDEKYKEAGENFRRNQISYQIEKKSI